MPVNLQLIIAPWIRSVGSSLWLCTARGSCRICPSSCWRRTAGIPHPATSFPRVLTGCVTCSGGKSCFPLD